MVNAKSIAIFGFGKEGISAANYFGNRVKVSIIEDKSPNEIPKQNFKNLKAKNIKFYYGKNFPKDEKFDLLVRSPGFRPDHPKIAHFTHQGFPLTSPTNIFFETCSAQIIGVTGTKGKGTASTLIYEMLKKQFKGVFLAGNIGTAMLDIVRQTTRESLVVLELSSFQLIDCKYSPQIAVVLMVTSEHLDWHNDQKEYIKAKNAIVKYQTSKDFAVINQDFTQSRSYAAKTKGQIYYFSTQNKTNGVYISNGSIYSQLDALEKICDVSKILLPGRHNLQNVCAAIAVAKILKIQSRHITKTVKTFKGLIHRLQLVKEFKGVKYYNDSFSTTPETTIAAIEAFSAPKILILGGSSKKSDFTNLGKKIKNDKSIKAVILIGQETPRLKRVISGFSGKIVEGAKNMSQIVRQSTSLSMPGDVIIISPACASFDMFKNYQDRGEQFIKEVKNLS